MGGVGSNEAKDRPMNGGATSDKDNDNVGREKSLDNIDEFVGEGRASEINVDDAEERKPPGD